MENRRRSDEPLIDEAAWTALSQLAANATPSFLEELIRAADAEGRHLLNVLKQCLAEGRREEAKRILHALRSSMSYLGASCLVVICRQAEESLVDSSRHVEFEAIHHCFNDSLMILKAKSVNQNAPSKAI